ncbi:hypothetical protein Mapa_002379 [Marchantia paleacea]|nr:hypothetical protein Mapa_002379 [Marchantia paleacea]
MNNALYSVSIHNPISLPASQLVMRKEPKSIKSSSTLRGGSPITRPGLLQTSCNEKAQQNRNIPTCNGTKRKHQFVIPRGVQSEFLENLRKREQRTTGTKRI